MAKDSGQASNVTKVTKRGDRRIEHFPSVVITRVKNDWKRLIEKGAVGRVTDLGQDVEAEDPFPQVA